MGIDTTNQTSSFHDKGGRGNNDNDMDPRLLLVISFIQRNILMVIAVVALVIVLIVTSNVFSNREDLLADQRAEIARLQENQTVATNDRDEDYLVKVQQGANGLDLQRKAEDDALFKRLMGDALNWESMGEYIAAREEVMRQWNIAEGSQFMTVFMPGEMQGVMRTDPTGQTHYLYDADISSRFNNAETHVIGINGDVYSYFALVTSDHVADTNNAVSSGHSIVTYDVVDGEILNLAAMTVPSGVKTSN